MSASRTRASKDVTASGERGSIHIAAARRCCVVPDKSYSDDPLQTITLTLSAEQLSGAEIGSTHTQEPTTLAATQTQNSIVRLGRGRRHEGNGRAKKWVGRVCRGAERRMCNVKMAEWSQLGPALEFAPCYCAPGPSELLPAIGSLAVPHGRRESRCCKYGRTTQRGRIGDGRRNRRRATTSPISISCRWSRDQVYGLVALQPRRDLPTRALAEQTHLSSVTNTTPA